MTTTPLVERTDEGTPRRPGAGDDETLREASDIAVGPVKTVPRQPRRGLPGWAIDLVRDGVPTEELKRRGRFAVRLALRQTAQAAINAGWPEVDWWTLVREPRSELGAQAGTLLDKRGRRKRATERELLKVRQTAWREAEEAVSGSAPYTSEQVRMLASQRAAAARLIVEDLDYRMANGQPMLETDRAVLDYLADRAVDRGLTRVAESRRAIMGGTELGRTAVDKSLERLRSGGLIRLYRKGRPGRNSGYADVWELLPEQRRRKHQGEAGPIEAGLRPAYGAPRPGRATYGAPVAGRSDQPVHMAPPGAADRAALVDLVAALAPDKVADLRAIIEAALSAEQA